ncbi:MAG: hypothetical protein LBU05_07490, partial [Bifidobacteriaceae bacterium]|nr:hypothetical protein [Bifidobacteriaceae bacterium]
MKEIEEELRLVRGKASRSASLVVAAASVLALAAGPALAWPGGTTNEVGSVLTGAPAAKDRDEIEKERAANQQALDQLAIELEGTSTELGDAYLKLETANKELPLAEATLLAAQSEYAAAQQEYEETVDALARAESQRDEVTTQLREDITLAAESRQSLGALARDAMMGNAAASSDLMVLLGAATIDDAAKDLMAAGTAARTRQAVITQAQQSAAANKSRQVRLETVTQEIADLKAKAEDAMAKAEAAQVAAEEAKAALERLKASMETLTVELEAQKAAAEAKQTELEKSNQALQAELDELLAREAERIGLPDPGGGGGSGGSGGPAPSTPGFWGRPLNSIRVASPFGWRIHPIYGTRRHHDGVDLSAGCGAPIYASAAGTVIYTGYS